MLLYFDSDAFLALLLADHGHASELVARCWDGADAVLASAICDVEVPSALALAVRDRVVGADEGLRALQGWQRMRRGVRVVAVSDAILTAAAELAVDALEVSVAIHIASAMQCAADGLPGRYLAVRPSTASAARALGLTVLEPSLGQGG